MKSYMAFLDEGCGHHDNGDTFLPDHPPEVWHGVCDGALSRYVLSLLVPVALCRETLRSILYMYVHIRCCGTPGYVL